MSKLHFFYGAMGSSKSAHLMMQEYNLRSKGENTGVIKPVLDTKSTIHKISSRIGLECECAPMAAITDKAIITRFPKIKWLFVDEAQFYRADDIDQLARLADLHGINVFAYGLMVDINNNLFSGSKRLVEAGARLHQMESTCSIKDCGRPATHNLLAGSGKAEKDPETGNPILITDSQIFGVCRRHWHEGQPR